MGAPHSRSSPATRFEGQGWRERSRRLSPVRESARTGERVVLVRREEMGKKERVHGVWENPPPPNTKAGLWKRRKELLKKRPGQWMRFGPYSTGGGASVKRAHPDLEITTRTGKDGKTWVYARYPASAVSDDAEGQG